MGRLVKETFVFVRVMREEDDADLERAGEGVKFWPKCKTLNIHGVETVPSHIPMQKFSYSVKHRRKTERKQETLTCLVPSLSPLSPQTIKLD